MRRFEKISFEQFKLDVRDDEALYKSIRMPQRDSKHAAGYDFFLLDDLELEPGEIKQIPTGIKGTYGGDEVLLLIDRSSTGFKHNVRLCNQVGVIDADYYNNPDNEGHIWYKIQNEGEKKVVFRRGEAVIQGVFMRYLLTDDDDPLTARRRSEKTKASET